MGVWMRVIVGMGRQWVKTSGVRMGVGDWIRGGTGPCVQAGLVWVVV